MGSSLLEDSLILGNGKENGNYRDYGGFIGVNIGVVEAKLETTAYNASRAWLKAGGLDLHDRLKV